MELVIYENVCLQQSNISQSFILVSEMGEAHSFQVAVRYPGGM